MTDIARVDFPITLGDFYLHFYTQRRPVVIRTSSVAELGWQTHLWSNEYLNFKAGAHEVLVLKRGGARLYEPEQSAYIPMPFRTFIQDVMAKPEGDSNTYLNLQTDKVMEPPLLQLLGDFSIPIYFKDVQLRSVNLWMGNSVQAITTPLHHDFNDNLYVVVEGRKRFSIFPPQQAPNLYPRGVLLGVDPNGNIRYQERDKLPHLAQVDIERPDMQRFPRYAEAAPQRMDFEVLANEMLFLPNGWFHQVTSVGRHIAVNFFAETPPAEKLASIHKTISERRAARQAHKAAGT